MVRPLIYQVNKQPGTVPILIIFLILFFFCLPTPALAETFATSRQLTYSVDQSSHIRVQEQVTITNLTTQQYPQTYQIKLGAHPIQDVYAEDQQGTLLHSEIDYQDNNTIINVEPTPNPGKDKQTQFIVYYTLTDLVNHASNMTEFVLPSLDDQHINDAPVYLRVSNQLENLAYLNPQPIKTTTNSEYHIYQFQAHQLTQTNLKAAFGLNQIYQFIIYYHLEDQPVRDGYYRLAIPPDTPYQQVILSELSQSPTTIEVDEDGNWIGLFPQNVNSPVTIKGAVQVYHQPLNKVAQSVNKQHLQSDEYWQYDQLETAPLLSDPQNIYNIVTQRLQYNYQKPGYASSRQGLMQSLQQPEYANCMEYTDVFIGLARQSSIPARRVIGYAHSDNPRLRPLLAQSDILHTWPEYWNPQTLMWKPVDPTWEATSQGTDYFHTWDTRHVVLSYNGYDSQLPFPPGFRVTSGQSKNIIFTPINDFPESTSKFEASIDFPFFTIPLVPTKATIHINNQSNRAFHFFPVILNNTSSLSTTSGVPAVKTLPPYSTQSTTLKFKLNQLLLPEQLIINLDNQQYTVKISQITRIKQIIFYVTILFLYVLASIYTIKLARQAWSLHFQRR